MLTTFTRGGTRGKMFKIIIPSKIQDNLLSCVASVFKNEPTFPHHNIIVIDDGSFTPTLDVQWIRGIKPFVYARNVNLGIVRANSDVIVMNDDSTLLTPNGFTKLSQIANEHPEFGVIGPALTQAWVEADKKHTENDLRQVFTIMGFMSVYIPTKTQQQIGLLDERFIGYGWDDWDYCRRCEMAGLKLGIYDGTLLNPFSMPSTYRDKERETFMQMERLGHRLYDEKWSSNPIPRKPLAYPTNAQQEIDLMAAEEKETREIRTLYRDKKIIYTDKRGNIL